MLRFHLVAFSLICIVGIVSYSNILRNSFVYDDISIIVENPAIKQLNLAKIYAANSARFIGNVTFAVNYWLGGTQVFGYHLVNILIHIAMALFMYLFIVLLARSVLNKQGNAIALLSALLFVSHPLSTQAVTYTSQRFASLAALFYVITLTAYLVARQTGRKIYYIFSFLSMLAAFFTKENTYTLPFAILLLELTIVIRAHEKTIRRAGIVCSYFLATVIVLLVTRIIPVAMTGDEESGGAERLLFIAQSKDISRASYIRTQPSVVVTYLKLLVYPTGQNLDYEYALVESIGRWEFIIPLCILLSVLLFGLWQYKRNRLLFFGIFFFFLTISIESSFIPIAEVFAEHRIYLPGVGFFLAMVTLLLWISNRIRIRRKMLYIVMLCIVLIYSYSTYQRNKVWKDEVSLFTEIVKKSPHKAKPRANLGAALLKQNKLDEALIHLEKAAEMDNRYAFIYNNIGIVYERRGNTEEALRYYRIALTREPTYPRARNNIASLYYKSGQIENAAKEYETVLQSHPDDPEAHHGLGVSLYLLKREDEGVEHVKRAIELDPEYMFARENLEKMRRELK